MRLVKAHAGNEIRPQGFGEMGKIDAEQQEKPVQPPTQLWWNFLIAPECQPDSAVEGNQLRQPLHLIVRHTNEQTIQFQRIGQLLFQHLLKRLAADLFDQAPDQMTVIQSVVAAVTSRWMNRGGGFQPR